MLLVLRAWLSSEGAGVGRLLSWQYRLARFRERCRDLFGSLALARHPDQQRTLCWIRSGNAECGRWDWPDRSTAYLLRLCPVTDTEGANNSKT
jgi:hypothetical protein